MAVHELNVNRWKRLRESVLKRDRYLDQVALRYGKRIEANTVHHIFPREFFPEYTYASWNLISVSHKTHNTLHDRDTHKLTAKGFELLQRTARRNNIELPSGIQDLLM